MIHVKLPTVTSSKVHMLCINPTAHLAFGDGSGNIPGFQEQNEKNNVPATDSFIIINQDITIWTTTTSAIVIKHIFKYISWVNILTHLIFLKTYIQPQLTSVHGVFPLKYQYLTILCTLMKLLICRYRK